MKKMFFCLFAVTVIAFSACTKSNNSSTSKIKVTVVKNEGWDYLLGGYKVMAITLSGDSVESYISEGCLFEKKIPFTSTMKVSEMGRYGFIEDSAASYVFNVIVTRKLGYNWLLNRETVLVTTKSGMSVECMIPEGILLKSRIPFPARMKKVENERYGLILP